MPAYFSIVFSFETSHIKKNIVREIYNSIFDFGFPFKGGFYDAEGMSLDEIIDWNQKKLQKGFILGMKQHFKHDYKQILFQTDNYKELRGLWFHWTDGTIFELIVPEYDVMDKDDNFLPDKVAPFRALSIQLWENNLVDAVQTHTENGGPYSLGSLKKGPPIADVQFAIANKNLLNGFEQDFFHNKRMTGIGNNGMLIDNLDPWGFFEYWRSLGKSFECN